MAILASIDTSAVPAAAAVSPEPVDSSSAGTAALAASLVVPTGAKGPLKPVGPIGNASGPKSAKGADPVAALDPIALADPAAAKDLPKVDPADAAALAAAAALVAPGGAAAQAQSSLDRSLVSANPVAAGGGARPDLTAGSATDTPSVLKYGRPQANLENAPAAASSIPELASEPVGKAGKGQKDAQDRLAAFSAALAAPADAKALPDPRVHPVNAREAEQPLAAMSAALVMSGTPGTTRREDPARDRSVFRVSTTESTAVAQAFQPAGANTPVQAAADTQGPTDAYVAQKVAYWISNDVQNAEMKLDGIGLQPVEVSIRMQGNEAHVAFRTDELQARAALENAAVHLKELLQREGLVLSGVSVGTAGAGDSGDQERRPRQGARQSMIASVQPGRADGRAIAGRVTGGALDLFV
jgi:flagellar hook-length control protein FliK